MQCPKCGKEVDLSDAFCRGCGQALGANPPVTKAWKAGPLRIETRTVTHVICGGCRKEVPLGEKTCPSCGRMIPSKEEIEEELKQATKIASTATEKIPANALACSHCGGQIDLTEGKCKSCGKPLDLTGPILEAVRKATSGLPAKTFTVGPIQALAQLKIGLSKLSGIFSVGGFLIFLAALIYVPVGGQHVPRQIPTLHGPWSPLHFVAFIFWGLALLLLLADKLQN